MTMLSLRSHCRGLGLGRRRSRSDASATTFEAIVADGIASGLTVGAPTVTALAELALANGIAAGPTFGAAAVAALAELVVGNGIASGLTFGAATIGDGTPSVRTQIIQGRAAADPHNVPTSGFGWVADDLVLAFTGTSATVTLGSLAGLTNDSYTQLVSVLPVSHNHRQYLHRGTINGGAFDSTTRWDLSGSRSIVLALLSIIGGHPTLDASATNFGTGSALPSLAAITTTGPTRLIIGVATIRGTHVTNPPSAPAGYTLLGNAFTTTNNPTATGQSTISVVYKAQAAAGTVAAASWGGLSNIGTQPWETIHIAVQPA